MAEHNRLVAIIFMLVAYISSAVASETANFQHLSLNSMFPQITINGLYQDESGVLWIGTKDYQERPLKMFDWSSGTIFPFSVRLLLLKLGLIVTEALLFPLLMVIKT